MSTSKRASGSRSRNPSDSPENDYQRAMDRLDAAVRNLGDAAKDSLADRAALILEETTARLKHELNGSGRSAKNRADDSGEDWPEEDEAWDTNPPRSRRREGFSRNDHTTAQPGYWRSDWRSTSPVRDLDRKRIWGVCAGIAPYLGLKIWVVRCIAITGLIFMSQVIVPAYIIGALVLDPVGGSPKQRTRRAKRRSRRARKARANSDGQSPVAVAPRTRLRTVRGTLDEAEFRLRRMERHVTSSRFELQRELNKIDV